MNAVQISRVDAFQTYWNLRHSEILDYITEKKIVMSTSNNQDILFRSYNNSPTVSLLLATENVYKIEDIYYEMYRLLKQTGASQLRPLLDTTVMKYEFGVINLRRGPIGKFYCNYDKQFSNVGIVMVDTLIF